jgi:hypothetical protein
MHKWIIASRELDGRVNLLETVMDHLDHIIDDIDHTYSTDFKVEGGVVQQEPPRVLTAEQFQDVIRKEIPKFSEYDIDCLTKFGVKGSKRQAQLGEPVNNKVDLRSDLIQFKHFERALPDTIQALKRDEIEKTQKAKQHLEMVSEAQRVRAELDELKAKQKEE